MQFLIGGSPSTGSSLLRQMLNRHPDVYCGPETNLFVFPGLTEKWASAKQRLTGRASPLAARLKSPSIRIIERAQLVSGEHGWDRAGVDELLRKSRDFRTFAGDYFARPCKIYGKKHWAEKTPENVLAFGVFPVLWESGHMIHIVRDPADTVTSLLSRGHTLFYAVARYLYNTAFGLKRRGAHGYHEVRYDTLVAKPERTLTELLLGLGLPFEPVMLQPGNPHMSETDQMKGWQHSELETPGTLSIGRYLSESEETQLDVAAALYLLRIPDAFSARHFIQHRDIPSLAHELGFALPPPASEHLTRVHDRLAKEMQRHRWYRLRRFDWFFEREKPLEIISETQVGRLA